MLTVPLGAALTADSVFSDEPAERTGIEHATSYGTEKPRGVDNPNFQIENGYRMKETEATGGGDGNTTSSVTDGEDNLNAKMPRWIYLSIMVVMVIIAAFVNSLIGIDERTTVILIAQVFNGVLLPFFSICLLLCINDSQFMGSRPQTGWANGFLIVSVTITLFLASNVLIQKIIGAYINVVEYKLLMAGILGLGIMTALLIITSLGRDLISSFRNHCWYELLR